MWCQLERGGWENAINTQRQRPAECLHFLAAGLIMEECEDVVVMSALDDQD